MHNKLAVRRLGFTLVELMVVVVIIGVLSAIAIPAYMKYLRSARTTEATGNLAAIQSFEESYFSENDAYVSTQMNPATLPRGGTKGTFVGTLGGWTNLGRVIPNGQQVYFQYQVTAGGYNSGATIFYSPDNSGSGGVPTAITHGTGNGCTQMGNSGTFTTVTPTSLGIAATANTFWFVATAMGDQDSDNICSLFVVVTDRPDVAAERESE